MAQSTKASVKIGNLWVGPGFPCAVMGIINVSPDSFYQASVMTEAAQVKGFAKKLSQDGAHIIDLGAASTAPYLKQGEISEEEEARRLCSALAWVKEAVGLPVSADTRRATVAERAIAAGADMVNDISGLKYDKDMARVIAGFNVPVILGAFESDKKEGLSPIQRVSQALKQSLDIATSFQISQAIVDPAIGFFRHTEIPWHLWDLSVIKELPVLKELGRPICIGLSRKSFLGKVLDEGRPEARFSDVSQRLVASLAAEAIAVFNGADMVRTHDVKECVQMVRIAQAIRKVQPL